MARARPLFTYWRARIREPARPHAGDLITDDPLSISGSGTWIVRRCGQYEINARPAENTNCASLCGIDSEKGRVSLGRCRNKLKWETLRAPLLNG